MPRKVREIGVDIERHAVERDPLLHANANRGDLVLVAAPFSGRATQTPMRSSRRLAAHIESRECSYDPFLERDDKAADVGAAAS